MRVLFMGSPAEVISPLNYLFENGKSENLQLIGVVSQPARPFGRKQLLQDPPVAQWAKSKGLKCLQPESAKSPEFLNELRLLTPDVIVTAAYGQILSDAFLEIPSRATINIHPSALPKFRGATPVPAILLEGLKSTSVSILFTVKKLDAGNIILQKEFSVAPAETSGELTQRLFDESGSLLIAALKLLGDSNFIGQPQDDSTAPFCKKIEKDSGKILWNESSERVFNRFRAFQPWPGSWTTFRDKRIVISSMNKVSEDNETHSLPGEFLWDKDSKKILVRCGQGSISVSSIKPAGSNEMPSASFWNGLKTKDNLVFQSSDIDTK